MFSGKYRISIIQPTNQMFYYNNDNNNETCNSVTITGKNEPKNEQEECPVCLDELKSDNILTSISCNHTFCVDCVKKMYDKSIDKCPLCRKDFYIEEQNKKRFRLIEINKILDNYEDYLQASYFMFRNMKAVMLELSNELGEDIILDSDEYFLWLRIDKILSKFN